MESMKNPWYFSRISMPPVAPLWRWHPIVVVAGQQLTIQGGDLGQMFQDLGTRVQKTISSGDLCDWVLTI